MPGAEWAPRIALVGTASLIILYWLSGRRVDTAEPPVWPSPAADLPMIDDDWDPTTGRLVSLFTHRRGHSIFRPRELARCLQGLIDRRPATAPELPTDLRHFLDSPEKMPSSSAVNRWLDAIEGAA